VDGSTYGGLKSFTKLLRLLVDLMPGLNPQLEKKLKLDLEAGMPQARKEVT